MLERFKKDKGLWILGAEALLVLIVIVILFIG